MKKLAKKNKRRCKSFESNRSDIRNGFYASEVFLTRKIASVVIFTRNQGSDSHGSFGDRAANPNAAFGREGCQGTPRLPKGVSGWQRGQCCFCVIYICFSSSCCFVKVCFCLGQIASVQSFEEISLLCFCDFQGLTTFPRHVGTRWPATYLALEKNLLCFVR